MKLKTIDWILIAWNVLWISALIYVATEPRVVTINPMKTQVFKMMVGDFNKLKAGEGDQKELQRRLNIESNYLIGTPMPKGNK